ncbi:CG9593 [Drosophila busckii]|uniref:CG9593 n=1 Tax=Drosophila busckii TaxID=30019 RepID=A0A0M5J5H5_DROBS|nr:angiopoietin-2 [Drosophila busckii]ALC47718.1 CG9593 [Drosophila busckii]
MLLSTLFLLMLASSVPVPAETALLQLEEQLILIRNAQSVQYQKLMDLDFMFNQAVSKLSLQRDEAEEFAKTEFTKNNKVLHRVEKKVKQLLQNFSSSQDEMQRLLKLLIANVQETKETQPSVMTRFEDVYIQPVVADCSELDEQQRLDGVYKLLEPELNEVQRDLNERHCVFATSGTAWTVIQQRNESHPLVSFQRSWDEYRAGFGSLNGNFWFGNEFIHKILYRNDYVLRIELEDQTKLRTWVEYELFRLDSESYYFELLIGNINNNSTALDALTYHNGKAFNSSIGWWTDHKLAAKGKSNLNGQQLIWGNNYNTSLISSRMLIRPRKCNIRVNEKEYDEDSTFGL